MRRVQHGLRLRHLVWLSLAAAIGLSTPSLAATASSPNRITNPSFEASTTGWSGWNAGLKRTTSAYAPNGQYVAQLTRSTGTAYSIDNWPGLTSITAGTTYTASAYAAAGSSSAVGKPVRLTIREHTVGGSTVAQVQSSPVLLGASTSFTKVSGSFTARTAGDELDVYLVQTSAASGDVLLADDFVLVSGSDPSPTPTPGPTPTPSPTPTFPPSPSNTWWSWPAPTATIDPNSATIVSQWIANYFPKPGYMTIGSFGVATADTTSTSPCYHVPLTSGGTEDATVCIPLGTRPDPSSDGHLTVRDTIHGRETDFWQAQYASGTQRIISASSAASFPIGYWTEHDAPCGWAGDAACLPLRRGLVTPQDIASGVIDHPLAFVSPQIGGTSSTYRYPATHNAPTGDVSHMVEGTWLRMDPSVRCGAYGLPSWQVMVCVALQKYGMFLRDNGGQVAIYGEDTINQGGASDWNAVGLPGSSGSAAFAATFPWSRLQVLNPPPSS